MIERWGDTQRDRDALDRHITGNYGEDQFREPAAEYDDEPTGPAVHPDWVDPQADLDGVDGNVFAIIGFTRNALKRADNPPQVMVAYLEAVREGDYDNAVAVSMAYCGMV